MEAVTDMDVCPMEPAPESIIAGTFVIYDDGNGGFVVVSETDRLGMKRNRIGRKELKLLKLMSAGKVDLTPDRLREMVRADGVE